MIDAKKVLELEASREQRAPEFAKAARERRGKKNDGTNQVSHTVVRSRKQEAGAAKDLGKPARRPWQRPSMLPAIPDPPGYHIEYVRRDNRNRGDNANLGAHLRSGWEYCKTSDFDIEHLPTVSISGYGEVIGNDDTVLMKIHEETWAERNAHFEQLRDATTAAINRKDLPVDVSHPAMPIVDQENRTESNMRHMRGRRAASVASD